MAFLVDNIAPTTLGIEGVIAIGGGGVSGYNFVWKAQFVWG